MASEQQREEWTADAADYVAGNFSADEAAAFAQRLMEQPELQAEVNQLETALGLMLDELPLEEPPARLRSQLLAQMETSETQTSAVRTASAQIASAQTAAAQTAPAQTAPDPTPESLLQGRRRSGLLPGLLPGLLAVVAAGTAAIALALGLSNQRLRLANEQLQQELLAATPAQQAQLILQQPATRFYDFAGTKNAADAFGSMIVDTDGLEAAIAFKNLEPLPATQTYALWVRYQGEYIPCGSFETDPGGTTFATLSMPPVYQSRPWVREVIVTIEPTELPAQPTGPIVAETV